MVLGAPGSSPAFLRKRTFVIRREDLPHNLQSQMLLKGIEIPVAVE